MMLTELSIIAFAGVCWRLGGGAFTTLTGVSFGTGLARALRASLAVTFPVFLGWFGLLAIPALFAGVAIAGWGPFQGMGLPAIGAPEKSWKRWLPETLGFKTGAFWHDFMGMAACGVICMAPLAAVLWLLEGTHTAALILTAGVAFAPCYALARIVPWRIPRFAAGQEWGEVFTGAMLGAVFLGSVLCPLFSHH